MHVPMAVKLHPVKYSLKAHFLSYTIRRRGFLSKMKRVQLTIIG